MLLVDSSVWVDYFRGRSAPHTDRLDQALQSELVCIGDLILLEVLQGFQSDRDYRTAKAALLQLEVRTLSSPSLALAGADHFRSLRAKGVSVRKTVDTVIATYCIDQRIPLLHNDRDFEPFHEHLGLLRA